MSSDKPLRRSRMGFPIAFKLSWGQPWKILPVNSIELAQHGITARCGVNRSLEFRIFTGMPERLFESSRHCQKLGWASPRPIDLQNYANDYTILILINWFETGCMITMYLGPQAQVEPSPSERFSSSHIVRVARETADWSLLGRITPRSSTLLVSCRHPEWFRVLVSTWELEALRPWHQWYCWVLCTVVFNNLSFNCYG